VVFAALAGAWLIVLVPMVARRRQVVARTADSALAARVLRRGGSTVGPKEAPDVTATHVTGRMLTVDEGHRPAPADPTPPVQEPGADDHPLDDHEDPAHEALDDTELDEPELDDGDEPGHQEPRGPRPYRPGRGGFDPRAAELAAAAKYSYRQRVVLMLLITALVTGLLAGFVVPLVWYVHAAADLTIVAYLTYLRRQVRIENEVRQRRLARMRSAARTAWQAQEQARRTGAHHPAHPHPHREHLPAPRAAHHSAPPAASTGGGDTDADPAPADDDPMTSGDDVTDAHADSAQFEELPPEPVEPSRAPIRTPLLVAPPGTVIVEIDDDDPAFEELVFDDPRFFRRAAGQ
jgi:hypothetical protein